MYAVKPLPCTFMLTSHFSNLRNQLESPLLRLPPETRNEILRITVLSTYSKPISDYDRQSGNYPLSRTRVCKQLYAETRLLPFALCTLSFDCGKELARFLEQTSLEQQQAVTTIHLEFACEPADDDDWKIGPKMAWPIDMADTDDVPAAPSVECFRSMFSNLQKVTIDVVFFDKDDEDFVKDWIANVEGQNGDLSLDIQAGFQEWCDYWKI